MNIVALLEVLVKRLLEAEEKFLAMGFELDNYKTCRRESN